MPFPASPSLDTLYFDHNGWLRGLLYRRFGCAETAADLAHDTFLRLLASRQLRDPIREPRAYLNRIALRILAIMRTA